MEGTEMIYILTLLLIALFACQYLCQSTKTLRRVNTASRIRTGRLSYNDIVKVSQQIYRGYWVRYKRSDGLVSPTFRLSSNGRLYYMEYSANGYGQKVAIFVSRQAAIQILKETIEHTHYVEAYQGQASLSQWIMLDCQAALI